MKDAATAVDLRDPEARAAHYANWSLELLAAAGREFAGALERAFQDGLAAASPITPHKFSRRAYDPGPLTRIGGLELKPKSLVVMARLATCSKNGSEPVVMVRTQVGTPDDDHRWTLFVGGIVDRSYSETSVVQLLRLRLLVQCGDGEDLVTLSKGGVTYLKERSVNVPFDFAPAWGFPECLAARGANLR